MLGRWFVERATGCFCSRCPVFILFEVGVGSSARHEDITVQDLVYMLALVLGWFDYCLTRMYSSFLFGVHKFRA